MSKMADMMLAIEEHLDLEMTDQEVADKLNVPVQWVRDARDAQFFEDHVAPFMDENW